MQLRFLRVTGPRSVAAHVDFGPGLNVIYGGSNTGKTYILRLIDYLLGAKNPPEPIIEQAEYDLAHLGIVQDDGSEKTLVRALRGGDIRILEGLVLERPGATQGFAVSSIHGAKASLSKLLLSQLGAEGARVRTDAAGKTRELSFRDLERHALIDEAKIQSGVSPVLSGQFVTKTAETSVFKYMLTGVDDSALDLAKADEIQPMRKAAQLELLDKQILEFEREIAEVEEDYDEDELSRLEFDLETELTDAFQIQESAEVNFRQLSAERKRLRREYDAVQDRVSEIQTLLRRFGLLSQHYASDLQRLQAIAESGQFFLLEDQALCPVCGSPAEHQNPQAACDGNVEQLVAASMAEASNIKGRSAELEATVRILSGEQQELEARAREILPRIDALQAGIFQEVPAVQAVRAHTKSIVQKQIRVQRKLDLFRRRNSFIAKRTELGVSPGYDSSTLVAQQQLDGAVLDLFCQFVEAELREWQFPGGNRVFFELPKMDISVGGKSRGANGKGVRALLHAAFSIALMKFCVERARVHPGFVVLDSLFVTYRDPSDSGDEEIAGTPLKDRAFQAFARLPESMQLIVLENVDVPDWLSQTQQCVHFSGEPALGRAGFFPSVHS